MALKEISVRYLKNSLVWNTVTIQESEVREWVMKISPMDAEKPILYPPLGKLPVGIRTSLVVQWLRICLLVQGTWIWSLVWKDAACLRTTTPTCYNSPRTATAVNHVPRAYALQREESPQWEAQALQGRVDPTHRTVRKPHAKQPRASTAKKKRMCCCLWDFPGSQWLRISPANAGNMA